MKVYGISERMFCIVLRADDIAALVATGEWSEASRTIFLEIMLQRGFEELLQDLRQMKTTKTEK